MEVDWYLARDGQQHGPLTEAEMRKFHELGHLRRTDLVWRTGFPDWRPATAVFSFAKSTAKAGRTRTPKGHVKTLPSHYRKEWPR